MTHHYDKAETNNNAERNYQVRVDVEWEIVVEHECEALKETENYSKCLTAEFEDFSPFVYM
jgi:hypothetical protein